MNDKHFVLEQVAALAQEGSLAREELLEAYDGGAKWHRAAEPASAFSMANLLLVMGPLVASLSVMILLIQHLNAVSDSTAIALTLGLSVLAFAGAGLISANATLDGLTRSLFLLSALLYSAGYFEVAKVAGIYPSAALQAAAMGSGFSVFILGFVAVRRSVLLLFSIIFATWALYAAMATFDWESSQPYCYLTIAIGLGYLFIAWGIEGTRQRTLAGFLNPMGALFVLGAAFILGGWRPDMNMFWEVVFPAIAFVFVRLSSARQNRAFYVVALLSLLAYVVKLSVEYFSESVGWPVAVLVAGIGIIFVGFLIAYTSRKPSAVQTAASDNAEAEGTNPA